MNMSTIFRIENINEIGPYNAEVEIFSRKHIRDDIKRPSPWSSNEDCKLSELFKSGEENYKKFSFGFNSLEDLNSWFNKGDMYLLARHNFYLTKYEIDENYVIYGKKQLVFLKTEVKSKMTRRLEPSVLGFICYVSERLFTKFQEKIKEIRFNLTF